MSPKVFISYSHDSDEHMVWVLSLAERLVHHGVYVVLDVWDVDYGDDLLAYMEQGITSCDRVLIICTEGYIAKAKALKGGVGFEKMIITAEVAGDLGTKKFIPLIRGGNPAALPQFLGTRRYVDFRTDDKNYDGLLRTLFNVPKRARPPIGKNPFSENESSDVGYDDTLRSEKIQTSADEKNDQLAALDANDRKYHWHSAVHRYFGNKLLFIFIRFATVSSLLKPSILSDLQKSKISDYMIFRLYSGWDLLIRVWADEESFRKLKERFLGNPDLHHQKPPKYLVVEKFMRQPDGMLHASDDEIQNFCETEKFLERWRDLQERGRQSRHFKSFYDKGIVFDQKWVR
jgi:hypothetical protein